MTVLMLNGELIAPEKATLPATDRALTHGLGLYETLKLVGGIPVFFEEHVARLDLGLEELGLERPFPREEMAGQICRLSDASGVVDGACRVLVTAGAEGGRPNLLIQTDRRQFPARPLRVISYLGARVRAELKAMTVMQSYLAQRAATAAGADDAILVDDEGRIVEGAILPGVLRAKVEELAGAHGIPVVEAFARVADLRPDDGMLLTSSVRGIAPVGSVDGLDLRVDEALLGRLRSLVGEAEEASTTAFRDAYR